LLVAARVCYDPFLEAPRVVNEPQSQQQPSMSLEQILERLGHVVDTLEKGDLPLEQSLAMFEEGVRLTREGQRRLDDAERKIEALLSTAPGVGEPPTQLLPTPPAPGGR
jgi:exodeoxyribonuclease VII small subunit